MVLFLHVGLFKSIFLYETVEKARIFSSSFDFFFLVYTLYILPLKLFLLHSCFTKTQTLRAPLGHAMYLECPFTLFDFCSWLYNEEEYAVSLEIPINQVTHESIFVLFFIRNSRNMIIFKHNCLEELGFKIHLPKFSFPIWHFKMLYYISHHQSASSPFAFQAVNTDRCKWQ